MYKIPGPWCVESQREFNRPFTIRRTHPITLLSLDDRRLCLSPLTGNGAPGSLNISDIFSTSDTCASEILQQLTNKDQVSLLKLVIVSELELVLLGNN